uniref:uncharacterized protein LOC100183810 n=1 Tax=Ciona intestinalis TaxID=7719 RepID=UPI000180C81C|nr:uncharacterized protein LOC100183810 [Ciona intestinalis]|eukprot:XP_002126333.1 uncharacterized protein LOC100183810 [Ciona intestinalis]
MTLYIALILCGCLCFSAESQKILFDMSVEHYIENNALVHYDARYDTNLDYENGKSVEELLDQGLSQTHAYQKSEANQPYVSSKRQNGRRYLFFDGNDRMVANYNLNSESGVNDRLTVTIVYRINDNNANNGWVRNGLFGHDNGDFDKFITFLPDGSLVISRTKNSEKYISIKNYPSGVNPAANVVWNVLTVHWDADGGENASGAWCNGKLLRRFTASPTPNGSNKFVIGDLNPDGAAPFIGAIGEFVMFKQKSITDGSVNQQHQYFKKKWSI